MEYNKYTKKCKCRCQNNEDEMSLLDQRTMDLHKKIYLMKRCGTGTTYQDDEVFNNSDLCQIIENGNFAAIQMIDFDHESPNDVYGIVVAAPGMNAQVQTLGTKLLYAINTKDLDDFYFILYKDEYPRLGKSKEFEFNIGFYSEFGTHNLYEVDINNHVSVPHDSELYYSLKKAAVYIRHEIEYHQLVLRQTKGALNA